MTPPHTQQQQQQQTTLVLTSGPKGRHKAVARWVSCLDSTIHARGHGGVEGVAAADAWAQAG